MYCKNVKEKIINDYWLGRYCYIYVFKNIYMNQTYNRFNIGTYIYYNLYYNLSLLHYTI